jgi:hypothetical protein
LFVQTASSFASSTAPSSVDVNASPAAVSLITAQGTVATTSTKKRRVAAGVDDDMSDDSDDDDDGQDVLGSAIDGYSDDDSDDSDVDDEYGFLEYDMNGIHIDDDDPHAESAIDAALALTV